MIQLLSSVRFARDLASRLAERGRGVTRAERRGPFEAQCKLHFANICLQIFPWTGKGPRVSRRCKITEFGMSIRTPATLEGWKQNPLTGCWFCPRKMPHLRPSRANGNKSHLQGRMKSMSPKAKAFFSKVNNNLVLLHRHPSLTKTNLAK